MCPNSIANFSPSVLTALATRMDGHFLSRKVCTVRMWIRDSWPLKESGKWWGHLVVARRLYLWVGAPSLKACFLKVSPIILVIFYSRKDLIVSLWLSWNTLYRPGWPRTLWFKLYKICELQNKTEKRNRKETMEKKKNPGSRKKLNRTIEPPVSCSYIPFPKRILSPTFVTF